MTVNNCTASVSGYIEGWWPCSPLTVGGTDCRPSFWKVANALSLLRTQSSEQFGCALYLSAALESSQLLPPYLSTLKVKPGVTLWDNNGTLPELPNRVSLDILEMMAQRTLTGYGRGYDLTRSPSLATDALHTDFTLHSHTWAKKLSYWRDKLHSLIVHSCTCRTKRVHCWWWHVRGGHNRRNMCM